MEGKYFFLFPEKQNSISSSIFLFNAMSASIFMAKTIKQIQ